MDASRLSSREIMALVGAVLLILGLFLPWYETAADNPNSNIDGERGSFSGWDVHGVLRWLFLLAAIAPIVLTWIIIRGHQLSWARGEMTAVVSIAAAGLIAYVGVIDRAGEPSGTISLQWGWFVALLGTILMCIGSALRSSEVERRRKPPGSL
jgi:hypothetical protein